MTLPATIENPSESIYTTEYGIPIRNLWYMLLYAWNKVDQIDRWRTEVEHAPTLDMLLASILADLLQQRLRIGLGRSYVDEEKLLRGVRGRIDFGKSLKHRTFDQGRAYCRFQNYSTNVPKNQIIRSTLDRLVQMGQFGSMQKESNLMRQRLRLLSRNLADVDRIEINPDMIKRQQLGRNDGDYRLMLFICDLILQRQMPTESGESAGMKVRDKDSLLLHQVYERFVANFYKIHLTSWTVWPQTILSWHENVSNPKLPKMKPDVLLQERNTKRIIVLDTKFTPKSLINSQWGNLVYDSSHLYQMYAYLKSQEDLSIQHHSAKGILLYPAVNYKLSDDVTIQGHEIRFECIDLAMPWQDIERCLLNLILDSNEFEGLE